MKMREELELYKGKTIELAAQLETVQRETELVVASLKDDHKNSIEGMKELCRDEVEDITNKLTKEIESKTSTITYKNQQVTDLTNEVNNLHDVLDVIPGVMPRTKGGESYGAENKCHVRLASVLAQKFM